MASGCLSMRIFQHLFTVPLRNECWYLRPPWRLRPVQSININQNILIWKKGTYVFLCSGIFYRHDVWRNKRRICVWHHLAALRYWWDYWSPLRGFRLNYWINYQHFAKWFGFSLIFFFVVLTMVQFVDALSRQIVKWLTKAPGLVKRQKSSMFNIVQTALEKPLEH